MAITTTYEFLTPVAITSTLMDGPGTDPDVIGFGDGSFAIVAERSAGNVTVEWFDVNGQPTASAVLTGFNPVITRLTGDTVAIATEDGAGNVLYSVVSSTSDVVLNVSIAEDDTTAPEIATLSNGSFVIVTQDAFPTLGDDKDIDVRIYNAAGEEQLSLGFTIDSSSADDRNPTVAALTGGGYVVAWERHAGGDSEVWYAIYADNGDVVKAPAAVQNTDGESSGVSIVPLETGGFQLIWAQTGASNSRIEHVTFSAEFTAGVVQFINAGVSIANPSGVELAPGITGFLTEREPGSASSYASFSAFAPSGLIFVDVNSTTGPDFNNRMAEVAPGRVVIVTQHDDGTSSASMVTMARRLEGDGAIDLLTGDGLVDIMLGGGGGDTLRVLHGHATSGETYDGGDDFDSLSIVGQGSSTFNFRQSTLGNLEDLYFSNAQGGGATVFLLANQMTQFGSVVFEEGANGARIVNVAMGGETALDLSGLAVEGTPAVGDGFVVEGDIDNETITGTALRDNVSGEEGNDTLRGGGHRDTLNGGGGDDLLVVTAGDVVAGEVYDGGVGFDEFGDFLLVQGGGSIDLRQVTLMDLEGLQVSGDTTAVLLASQVKGFSTFSLPGANALVNVVMDAEVTLDLSAFGLGIAASARGFEVIGDGSAEAITGTDLTKDMLSGGGGNDTLRGGAGNDTLIGGLGNDTYVNPTGDVITELSGGGTDTVESDVTFTLSGRQFVENLILTGTGNINGTGNSYANVLTGNGGANVLRGGTGIDTVRGGDGNDTLSIVAGDDGVGETYDGGAEFDTLSVSGAEGSYTINLRDDTVSGIEAVAFGIAGAGTATVQMNSSSLFALASVNGSASADVLDIVMDNTFLSLEFVPFTSFAGSGDLVRVTGDGDPEFVDASSVRDHYDLGGGADSVKFVSSTTPANDTYIGGGGEDRLSVYGTGTTLFDFRNATISGWETIFFSEFYGGGATVRMTASQFTSQVTSISRQFSPTSTALVEIDMDASSATLNVSGIAQTGASLSSNGFILNGTAAANSITGGATGDRLTGGGGNDTLIGGLGNDIYVNPTGDVITELGGGGTDTVESDVTFTLSGRQQVENLTLTGGGDIVGTGNSLANVLTGNGGSNVLRGGTGIDTVRGGAGFDALVIVAGDDGAGETYDGGTDADTLEVSGPAGGSTINLRDDTVSGIEAIRFAAGGGVTVQMTASQFASQISSMFWDSGRTGAALVEITMNQATLNLSGFGFSDALRADDGFIVNGTGAAETITGSAINDRLIGGAGGDTLTGGLGNDMYVVSGADVIVELATGGTDTVEAAATFSLAALARVENLTLTGAGNFNAAGNAANNVLTGNSGNNILNGSTGRDTMIGGAGNDTYFVDNAGDVVTELSGGGTDVVSSSVSRTLTVNIENLNLSGSANIDGNGNGIANRINGNSGNNILRGDAGADTLNGGDGNDILLGGTSSDSLNPGVDAVRDIIRFGAVGESTGSQRDVVTGMDLNGEDVFDFTVVPTSLAFVNGGFLDLATINSGLSAAVNAALAANGAVLFDPSSGDLNVAGHRFLVVDGNGDGVYTPNQDYVVQLVNFTGALTLNDFI